MQASFYNYERLRLTLAPLSRNNRGMNRLCSIAPRIRAEMHSTGIPGLAIAVARKGESLRRADELRKAEHPAG